MNRPYSLQWDPIEMFCSRPSFCEHGLMWNAGSFESLILP